MGEERLPDPAQHKTTHPAASAERGQPKLEDDIMLAAHAHCFWPFHASIRVPTLQAKFWAEKVSVNMNTLRALA